MQRFFPTAGAAKVSIRAAILAVFVAVGCTRPQLAPNTAVVLVEMPFRNLDPLKATDAVSQKIGNLSHVALVRTGADMALVPELAESWRHEGYRKFHFKLRAGAVFHDGTPITAADVERSYREYIKDSPHVVAFARLKRLWVSGPRELHIETAVPQPFFLEDLPVLKVFKRNATGKLIGGGRYKITSETVDEVKLARFPEFFEAAPQSGFDTIAFRYVRDDTTRYQLLMRGDANVAISSLSITKTKHLSENLPSGLTLLNTPGMNFSYLSFNLRDEKLKKLKVREAIAHALDPDDIRRYRFWVLAENATGIVAPALKAYYEPGVKRVSRDLALAEKLLDEAGYPRKGRWRFSLTFKVTPEKFSYDIATMMAGQLRAVGIDIQIRTVESSTFFADIKAGNFDLFVSRWIGVNSPAIYFRAFHSSQIGKTNRGAYSNPEMDRLIDQGMVEVDDSRRKEIFSKVQRLAAVDLPYVNLWYWNNTLVGPSQMRDIVMYPNGNYLTLAQLRIEQ